MLGSSSFSFSQPTNKSDVKNLIKEGNKRVVEARLSDAKFFWDKDRSKNLIKQIANLKTVTFYEKLGTIYDKTQRIRKIAAMLSDDLNLNKEKIQIAASISKSDLCSDLVGEYPELQGVMGKYFALSQGFEEDVANSISKISDKLIAIKTIKGNFGSVGNYYASFNQVSDKEVIELLSKIWKRK